MKWLRCSPLKPDERMCVRPEAMVKAPKKGCGKPTVVMRVRQGRGFSVGELKEAGLSVREARRLGLYVDERRRSTHRENVEALRGLKAQGA
jgi:large subunit ribosomal protein L13e